MKSTSLTQKPETDERNCTTLKVCRTLAFALLNNFFYLDKIIKIYEYINTYILGCFVFKPLLFRNAPLTKYCCKQQKLIFNKVLTLIFPFI